MPANSLHAAMDAFAAGFQAEAPRLSEQLQKQFYHLGDELSTFMSERIRTADVDCHIAKLTDVLRQEHAHNASLELYSSMQAKAYREIIAGKDALIAHLQQIIGLAGADTIEPGEVAAQIHTDVVA